MSDAEDLAATVRALARREEALTLLHTYVDRIDAGDFDAVAALFVPDATFDFMGLERTGRDRIVARIRRALSDFDRTSHHVTNALVTLDGEQATVSAGLYAFHARTRTRAPWHFWGRYVLRLGRDGTAGAGWQIRHMALIGIDAAPLAPEEHALFPGRPDRRPVDNPVDNP